MGLQELKVVFVKQIVEIISQGCVRQDEYKVSGLGRSRPRFLSWSRVFLGRCNLLVWWWRWRRSVLPSRTDPVVSLGRAQTGNLHHRGTTWTGIQRKHRQPTSNPEMYQRKKNRKISPPTKASPAPFVSTMSLGSIFSTGNVSALSSEQRGDETLRHTEVTKGRQKDKIIKKSLTLGDSSVIFSLGQHYDPLPLCVYFGQSLGFLGNFLNVLGLQTQYHE